ncbi:hypothetical protein GCM10009840_03320 [Pseudolysinimonas kribbensis]|uniref:SRPBCC family protein n=1 Tax=Pseudolysinimonas kribbensis TaxID=433641 RepID=A0ABQ6K2V3_9MICO|nr:hypothetical protein [Pseudolysinimonas kribbensis]GMA94634.1 hypothetical protein GCM10025881_14580 [Pseudolysinimonas kribbensis]
MSIATAVRARVGGLRAPRPVPRAREVVVSRLVAAPLPVVRECCWDAVRHHVVHGLGTAKVRMDSVSGTIAIGPFRHEYRAALAAGPGAFRWRGSASSGEIRFAPIDQDHTRVDVVLRWTPRAAWAQAAVRVDLDRRQIEADLHRLALIAESQAAEDRLGPIAV